MTFYIVIKTVKTYSPIKKPFNDGLQSLSGLITL